MVDGIFHWLFIGGLKGKIQEYFVPSINRALNPLLQAL